MSDFTPGAPQIPNYKFAKIATRDSFLDLIDSYPPFLQTEILPTSGDLKNSKFQVTFTKVTNNQSHYYRHYLDRKQLLLLLTLMTQGHPGHAQTGYLPGFPEYKGSKDGQHPEWALTSRILGVKYMISNNFGPAYLFEFAAGRGKAGANNGIVSPDGPPQFKDSMVIPIYGSDRMPPLAMQFAHEGLAYLQAREVARQVVMAQSVEKLRWLASQGDANAGIKLQQTMEGLFGTRKAAPAPPQQQYAPPQDPYAGQYAQQPPQQQYAPQQPQYDPQGAPQYGYQPNGYPG